MNNIIWSNGHKVKFEDIIDADNCYLFDSKGNRLTDLESGVWCTSVGHNNKRINQVICAQINKISHTGFCYCHPQLETTAGKLLAITGIHRGKCEFLCSGSEAVEYGMRLSRAVSNRPLALAFSDAYFGAYGDAAAKDGQRWHIFNRLECSCSKPDEGCVGECQEFAKIPFDDIGFFVFEPGSSSGLVRFPSTRLISKIVTRLQKQGGFVFCNEITTGMGRTGKWFGFQHYDLIPAMVAVGKGLGNGYPVSAVIAADSVLDRLEKTPFVFAQSHQNDPLGAVIANEVIDLIEHDKLLDACRQIGQYLLSRLASLAGPESPLKAVRGRGLMLALIFENQASVIFEKLIEKGFILNKRPQIEVLRLDPPLTITKEIADQFLTALEEVFKEVTL